MVVLSPLVSQVYTWNVWANRGDIATRFLWLSKYLQSSFVFKSPDHLAEGVCAWSLAKRTQTLPYAHNLVNSWLVNENKTASHLALFQLSKGYLAPEPVLGLANKTR